MESADVKGRAVFLHGQPGGGVQWHRVVGALGGSFEVLAPDRPGYGHNPEPGGGFADNVAWLTELLSEQERVPTVVVAHSWAGGVGLEFARERPDLVGGLVLVASVGPGALNLFDRVLTISPVGEALIRPMFKFGDPILRRFVTRDVGDTTVRAEILASMDANRGRAAWRTFLAEQESLVSDLPAIVDRLGEITTPTIVVAGTRDRVVPFATAQRLSEELPRAELVTVEHGGHNLHRTHAPVVADAVHRVLTL